MTDHQEEVDGLRRMGLCSQMKGAAHDDERLSGDDPKTSYPQLDKTAKRQIGRRRLQVHRDELTKFIVGGNATLLAPRGGKKG